MNAKNEFLKIFNSIAYKHNSYNLFSDFVTMSAISMHNAIFKNEKLEAEYLQIAGKYDKSELVKICSLLSCVVDGLEDHLHDFLGSVFMELEISNSRSGQFFTPYPVCKMMAACLASADELANRTLNNNFLKLSEPCSGAGGMIIAFADAMQDADINYQQNLWVQAIDIDSTCAMMTYLQLSLLHIPAEVITGNTLTLKVFRTMKTPAHYMGNWDFKLKKWQEANNANTSDDSKVISVRSSENFVEPTTIESIRKRIVVTEQSCFEF